MGKLLKPALYGFLSSILLLVIYFFVMVLAKNSLFSALEQLYNLKLWVTPLVITFGVQVGLFVYAKDCRKNISAKSTTISATTSNVAMLACCAHHLTDLLPILGLSVAATFLVRYQEWFLALGILSNTVGIWLMLRQIRILKR